MNFLCFEYILEFFIFTVSSPLFSPVDPETDVVVPVMDYVDDDPPSRLSNQASPPLIIPISPILYSHACIRFCYCYCLLLF